MLFLSSSWRPLEREESHGQADRDREIARHRQQGTQADRQGCRHAFEEESETERERERERNKDTDRTLSRNRS